MKHIKRLLKEVKDEEQLLKIFNLAGEKITSGDIELADKTATRNSYDVYIHGEPQQVDVDMGNGYVYIYDKDRPVQLGRISEPDRVAASYKRLKGYSAFLGSILTKENKKTKK